MLLFSWNFTPSFRRKENPSIRFDRETKTGIVIHHEEGKREKGRERRDEKSNGKFLVGMCFRGVRYTSMDIESNGRQAKLRGTGKAYRFRGRLLRCDGRWFRIGWKSGGCRNGSDVAGRGGEGGGADRSACKRFPAPLRGVRGVRTYRCTDRGALRGAIPFSCHVQPMMRLLLSRASLSPFTISRERRGALSLSFCLRSLGARARPYVFFSLLLRSSRFSSISITFSSVPSPVVFATRE